MVGTTVDRILVTGGNLLIAFQTGQNEQARVIGSQGFPTRPRPKPLSPLVRPRPRAERTDRRGSEHRRCYR